jgi:hypothetical protein
LPVRTVHDYGVPIGLGSGGESVETVSRDDGDRITFRRLDPDAIYAVTPLSRIP